LFSSWLLPFSVVAVFSVAADSRSNNSPFVAVHQSLIACRQSLPFDHSPVANRHSLPFFFVVAAFSVAADIRSNSSPVAAVLTSR
jgi:hypothetical protein